ncbi:hypothetical protein LOY42_13695 [Pseudomonas sp. B21-023]|uniref:hypothetical protein n=1 Tax=unclassified Pseudomonas TaxID=196821 RepID=UPI0015569A02|nr:MULTISPECIES: hypothetical protein [unclassified Pseudomonas]NQD78195.1 hypothetical protein [Pseudomonas sp. CM27]UVM14360.1 hypothetical protein LOY42_13695 [Pseudomonas sp. B21-023]
MDAEVEQLVGQRAWLIYGESLGAILENVLSSYKRAGGFDELTRFHGSTAGYDVLMLLKRALRQQGHARGYQVEESFVEIRYRLRTYLGEALLRKIVSEHQGTPALRDALFAVDLGA